MKSLCIIAASLAAIITLPGCMTRKVTTTSPSGVTTTATVVDTNNLAIDASVLQAATSIAVTLVVEKDPSTIGPLKIAQRSLDGVLNGANQATTQDVINALKAQGNPTLSAEVTSLVGTVSAIEQKLLAKYGAEVAGQIAIELTRAVDAGMIIGLQGK